MLRIGSIPLRSPCCSPSPTPESALAHLRQCWGITPDGEYRMSRESPNLEYRFSFLFLDYSMDALFEGGYWHMIPEASVLQHISDNWDNPKALCRTYLNVPRYWTYRFHVAHRKTLPAFCYDTTKKDDTTYDGQIPVIDVDEYYKDEPRDSETDEGDLDDGGIDEDKLEVKLWPFTGYTFKSRASPLHVIYNLGIKLSTSDAEATWINKDTAPPHLRDACDDFRIVRDIYRKWAQSDRPSTGGAATPTAKIRGTKRHRPSPGSPFANSVTPKHAKRHRQQRRHNEDGALGSERANCGGTTPGHSVSGLDLDDHERQIGLEAMDID
ncbi:hypothetical protein NP233_g8803 [Leucocoprinus birnbaumii]|uniref:Uncharacterized protein n=1 Tax=Leucocoprinus birnbaumii TaxID=56174 RepID=A0AAD5YNR3_9AGAR|nr:hypothetical protein NP233_g8803 [Leucocoprinus birnbaumii]